jgi:hypothetical protein
MKILRANIEEDKMNSRRIVVLFVVLVMIFSSACFATNFIGQKVEDKAGELTEKLSTEVLGNVELTVESVTGASLEDLQLTQEAFSALSSDDIQATVNSAVGMDEEAVRAEYVLPEEAINITQLGEMVNFQVKQPMGEVVDFYRSELITQGLEEKAINTSITEMTANLVFTGHPSGKLMVVQMVALNAGLTNVSIRFEAE